LAKINGVNTDALYYNDDPSLAAEEVFDNIYKAMESGIDLIVVDSIPSMIPKSILEGTDSSKDTIALLARVMGKCVPKATALAAKTGSTLIFINQIRQKPGVMFGPTETTPGGDTLKFLSSLRLQITKRYGKETEVHREDENGIDQLIAQQSFAHIRKTRYSKGLKEGVIIPIYFEPFFPNPEETAFDEGRRTQVVKVREEKFYWKAAADKRIEGVGRRAFIENVMKANLLDALIMDIRDEAAASGIVLPPEMLTYKIVSDKEVKKKEAKQTKESIEIQQFLEEEAKKPQEAEDIFQQPVVEATPVKKSSGVNTHETKLQRSGKTKTGKAG
jgi:hypothetical protein